MLKVPWNLNTKLHTSAILIKNSSGIKNYLYLKNAQITENINAGLLLLHKQQSKSCKHFFWSPRARRASKLSSMYQTVHMFHELPLRTQY